MILKSDGTLKPVKDFTAQIQTLDIPGEVKAGYSPIGFVRCGRAACRISKINWKVRIRMFVASRLALCVQLACVGETSGLLFNSYKDFWPCPFKTLFSAMTMCCIRVFVFAGLTPSEIANCSCAAQAFLVTCQSCAIALLRRLPSCLLSANLLPVLLVVQCTQ